MTLRPQEVVPPGVVVGGYRIEKKLGSGGFGKVYLAWRDGRPYALKFIHLERMGEWGWRELFIMLRHKFPNVVRLLSHVEWPEDKPEYLVLVMEYVPGRTLRKWAEDENPCARDIARVMLKLARALEKVHAEGVLHRDLKDDNVLVREADGEPVLVDFGAGAMSGAPRVTRNALAPGDLRFRSPESVAFFLRQSREPGERYRYSPADELYALGVILYALLTDTYPIDDDEQMMLAEILSRQPESPHEMNSRVPRAFSDICMRLLEKEPQARMATAGALAEALEAALKEAHGDASWDMPLCYGWDAEGTTTEQEPALEDKTLEPWMRKWVREKPRRGKRPAPPAPAPLPAAAVPMSSSGPLESSVLVRRVDVLAALLKAALLLGVLALAGLGADQLLRRWRPAPPAPIPPPAPGQPVLPPLPPVESFLEVPTWAGGDSGEVAPPWKGPEAEEGAAPPGAATPAPVASMTLSKEDTRVKKKEKPTAPTQRKAGRCIPVAQQVCTGALCTLVLTGCPGAQVRSAPAPQACPAGAEQAMRDKLGLHWRNEVVALPPGALGKTDTVPVKEGSFSVRVAEPRNSPQAKAGGAILYGQLYIGEKRVYGRFTQARTPQGETIPVCMELYYADERGAEIESRRGTDTVLVPWRLSARVVEESFESVE